MQFDWNWNTNPFLIPLYWLLGRFIYDLIILAIIIPALEKYFGTIFVANIITRFQSSFLLWIVFLGAKKSDPNLGLIESQSEYSEALPQDKIKSVLLKVYLTCRSYGMVNELVQSFLFQNAFKLTSEFNLTTFYDECENSVKNIVSDLRIRNTNDPESVELNQSYIDVIKQVKPILSGLHNRLALGSICYYAVIAYGSSVGGVFENEIYRHCIKIANTLCFQNELYSTRLTNSELCIMYIDLLSVLLPSPSTRDAFDRIVNLCLNNSNEDEMIVNLKTIVSEFILNLNN